MKELFDSFEYEEGVYFQKDLVRNTEFEKKYRFIRAKEKRIYTDEHAFNLPEIAKDHPHANEWKIRKNSMTRLIKYLNQ